ncbi:MAG TPA: AAA family ATPase [Gaiellaceae bacterium]|jgi:ATP-dependent Zn protease|nr:AAA family ATPase [Gaiellaceae bacterium]
MTSLEPIVPGSLHPGAGGFASSEASRELASGWRRLTRAATLVALLTSPALVAFFMRQNHWPLWKALLLTFLIVISFRGLVDLLFRRFIPWPSLFGLESQQHREEDVLGRRRAWFWHFWLRLGVIFALLVTVVWLFRGGSWVGAMGSIFHGLGHILSQPTLWIQVVFVFFLFIANFAILMGPLLLMNMAQMRAFEPGDAEWGVKLDDVRGQAEAKEEVRRVVTIWQSGEAFERAGGKRERGLLFLGAPGTGKTMLAKALATGFNSPFVSMPGSGFAATFIGIDAIVVRLLARRAKKLARKWGGQCIVFIDEIDAVGMRRQSLQQGMTPAADPYSWRDVSDFSFYGPWGAQNPTGDLIVETRQWRERLFEQRAPRRWTNPIVDRIVNQFPGGMFGGMGMGGQLALNQLLVVMDGIDSPPFMRRVLTNRINTLLDASYIVPRRIGKVSLRIPRARPRGEQIYFIGATNVPMDRLDPALTRPGRMGRHVSFRTPTKEDRKDVFDLYLGKVAHDEELDTEPRRDEVARITNGYSPAMIDQVCSMALTNAQHEGKVSFGWEHLVQAMTTLESGTAVNVSYPEHELRSVAIHEAGHAVTAHVYRPDLESSRLSTRMRGGSLGHHQTFEREERFSRWQHEEIGTLVHVLGAMAAENVFYGENTGGVGGDLQTATDTAAWMVGTAGMRPLHFELNGNLPEGEDADEARERIMKRFERIGRTLMNRTRGSADFHADPIAAILRDPFKHAVAAQILGQAYVMAVNLVAANKDAVDAIATHLAERRELYGDELVELLDRQELVKPELDYTKEETWPRM